MARTYQTILNSLKASYATLAAAVGITANPSLWSKTDQKSLILSSLATQQAIEEQLYDSFTSNIETKIQVVAPQTGLYLQDKLLNLFEYNAVAVPIVQLDTVLFFPYYPNPNASFNVIKFCSVRRANFGTVNVLIAGGVIGTPVSLSGAIVSAAQAFINIITFDGINYVVNSFDCDWLDILGITVYFNGLYSAVILGTINMAIQVYLAGIPFDGSIYLDDLLMAIRNVVGVNRVIFNNIQTRKNTDTYGSGNNLVLNNNWVSDNYKTYAGYISLYTGTAPVVTLIPQ